MKYNMIKQIKLYHAQFTQMRFVSYKNIKDLDKNDVLHNAYFDDYVTTNYAMLIGIPPMHITINLNNNTYTTKETID